LDEDPAMIILSIRTDKPDAEVGLYQDEKELAYVSWLADRQLAESIHTKIQQILNKLSIDWRAVEGIVVFEGPGSFTGLRIGITVANALANANQIPIVASRGQNWLEDGIKMLASGQNQNLALPKYGSPPNITKPKK
jgi:tRNA threonylcarbamoyladenosine biosynthesis protein TsaB